MVSALSTHTDVNSIYIIVWFSPHALILFTMSYLIQTAGVSKVNFQSLGVALITDPLR